ncbi:hypothetical protein LSH36_210g03037 [Paralvinella palmiformis]|uniref:Uncharacterized protein n=1 Tax=Paralvinella palmiformis TaxID=53620 RepID=A0AAD9JQ45_9ANNE|nr:hypothetical protein LSH36_210g03037 [Paralvinella palmiformis]
MDDPEVIKRTMRRQRAKHRPKNRPTATRLMILDEWKTPRGDNPEKFPRPRTFSQQNMLNGLAFLPVDCVVNGLQFLKENTPDGLETLLEYFECTYVSGSFRRIQPPPFLDGTIPPLRMRRVPPL